MSAHVLEVLVSVRDAGTRGDCQRAKQRPACEDSACSIITARPNLDPPAAIDLLRDTGGKQGSENSEKTSSGMTVVNEKMVGTIMFLSFFRETKIQFKRALKQNNNGIDNDHLGRLAGKAGGSLDQVLSYELAKETIASTQ